MTTLIIVIVNVVLFIIGKIKIETKQKQLFYRNICKQIFTTIINSNDKSIFKVSILKLHQPMFYSFDNWKLKKKPYLKVISRFQTKQPYKKSKVKFYEGEGCVGIAYVLNQLVIKEIAEYVSNNPNKYYEESEKEFHLPKEKAEKLNDKVCSILCYPIRHFNLEDNVWGILSIDCMEKGKIKNEYGNKIDEAMQYYSTFFDHSP